EITIPGVGTFVQDRVLVGRVVAVAPADCKPPKSFTMISCELRPETPLDPFDQGPGMRATFHDPGISVVGDGNPSPINPDGTFTNEVRFGAFGTAEYDVPGFKGTDDLTKLGTTPFTITGRLSDDGTGVRIDAQLPEVSSVGDVGLGANNPTYKL